MVWVNSYLTTLYVFWDLENNVFRKISPLLKEVPYMERLKARMNLRYWITISVITNGWFYTYMHKCICVEIVERVCVCACVCISECILTHMFLSSFYQRSEHLDLCRCLLGPLELAPRSCVGRLAGGCSVLLGAPASCGVVVDLLWINLLSFSYCFELKIFWFLWAFKN